MDRGGMRHGTTRPVAIQNLIFTKPIQRILLLVALLLCAEMGWAAIKIFDGGGDGVSWNRNNNWNPNGTPKAGDDVIIPNGFSVTLNADMPILNSLTIEAGGILTSTGANQQRATTITINGTYINGSTRDFVVTTMNINSGGVYQHNINGGTIPTATWDANSTCLVTGITNTSPGGINQTFGNFTWDSNQTGWVSISPNAMSIQGNLNISNTGPTWDFAIEQDITVNQNLIITGGVYRICYGASRAQTIRGDVIISGGTLAMNTGTNGNYNGTLNVGGNFSHTSGTINENTGGGWGTIVFNGSSMQTYTSGGTLSGPINFIVNSGAYLQMGTGAAPAIISNGSSGTFTLSSGATLGVTSSEGITTTGATGNIQLTGTRSFNTGSNYIYNGSVAQVTGNGLTGVNNLTIDNPSGVTFNSGVTINVALNIKDNAVLNTGSNTINSNETLVLGNNGTLNVSSGGTMNVGANTISSSSNSNTFDFNVSGALNITSNPTIPNSSNIQINSGGSMTTKTLTLNGPVMHIVNDGTVNAETLQFQVSTAVITIENNNTMTVTNTLNISQGTAQFKNTGTLTVGQNYNSSPTSTYINCGTFTGKFNLNSGGKVINVGTFNTTQMDFGSSASRIENYAYFYATGGSINPSNGTIYNEGIFTLSSGASISGDGNLVGPSDPTKRGYFVWAGKATMNNGAIGPNLNFRNTSGASLQVGMFNNVGGMTWLGGLTWGNPDPSSLPPAACPNPDGSPATPIPNAYSACYGIDLISLNPTLGGVLYEWWTGSTTSRGSQITTSTSPSVTNYTSAGTVYLWAKNVSSGIYSPEGAAVAIQPAPSAAIAPSPASGATGVCYAGTTPLTSISWAAAAGATSYDVYFGAGGLPGTANANVTGTSYSVGALAANTTYYWRVVSKDACGNTTTSSTWSFTTAGSPCKNYCAASGDCTNNRHISRVRLGSIDVSSVCGGYSDFTGSSTNLTLGTNNTLTVNFTNLNGNYEVSVWIDWNQDGDFGDANETVVACVNAGNTNAVRDYTVTVPAGATLGSTRMRIRLAFDTCDPCGAEYGEVEDYTINVVPNVSITTGTISPLSYCPGEAVSVPYSITGTFTAGNVFTAQLSDASGSFASPVSIGSVTSTTAGTINATIPVSATGTGYRVRVVSNNPSVTGTDNGTNLTVSGPDLITSPGSQCLYGTDVTVTVSASSSQSGTFTWYDSGYTEIKQDVGSNSSHTVTISSNETYYVVLDAGGCTTPYTPVTAYAIIPPTLNASAGGSFCVGSNINLYSDGVFSSVYWEGPNGYYSTVEDPVRTNATTAMSGTYTVNTSTLSGVNLVANGDFEQGNNGAFQSSYVYRDSTFNAVGCWNNQPLGCEGTYSVVANPRNVHSNFATCSDYSSSGKYQMVINGATAANVTIWAQTVNVVPGTYYQFSYWVQSVVASNPSQLQLYINNVAAGPVYTASAATCNWTQFFYNWDSGSNTSATLELRNQNIVPSGNDFALDDIIFQHTCTASASVDVTIASSSDLPSVTVTADPSGSICAGESVTFTAHPVHGGSSPSYQWFLNGNPVGSNSPTYTSSALPLGNNSITCRITSSLACIPVGSRTITSNTLTMTVTDVSPLTIGTITQPTCTESTGSVFLSGFPATGTWTLIQYPGGSTSTGSGTSTTVAGLTEGTYNFTFSNANGCTSALSGNVVINAQPTPPGKPTITANGATTFCAGGSVTLSAPASSGYLWSTGATSQDIVVTTSGNYTVQVSNAAGCQSVASDPVSVTVNPLPSATLTVTDTVVCLGSFATITVQNTQLNVSYQLRLDSDNSNVGSPVFGDSGNKSFTITPSNSDVYNILATNTNNCSVELTDKATVTVNQIEVSTTNTTGDTNDCADFEVPFNANTDQYNPGTTLLSFTVTRQHSSVNWSFDFSVSGGAVYGTLAQLPSGAIGTSPIPVNTSTPLVLGISSGTVTVDSSVNAVVMQFYIVNTPGSSQTVVFNAINVEDANSCTGSNRNVSHTILPMPAIGGFN